MPTDQVQRFLAKLFRGVGSSRSRRLLGFVERGEWDRLQAESMPSPSDYRYPNVLLRDSITHAIVKKAVFPGDGNQRKDKAVLKFYDAEASCLRTNARIARLVGPEPGYHAEQDLRVISFIESWRKEIARVLGRMPDRLSPLYSRGSTLSDSGKQVTIPDKMSSKCSMYSGTESIWEHSVKGTLLESLGRPFQLVRANRLFTVPKNCEEDRLAAVEASASLSLQLAVGREIRERFNRGYKVDLSASQPIHREMARIGSRDQKIATIDLSSASDTVSTALVRALLPGEWFTLLNSLRATHTNVFGKIVYLEKFSTMGNGFTFELETLIFRSLCRVLETDDALTSVYGDDIIIDVGRSADMLAALRFFGFTPNEKKTFCEGPFRESCGGDFFDGHPVRGHYMKELPDEPQHWVALANGLLRVDPNQRWTRAAWRYCVDQIPTSWRVFGPVGLGDMVLHPPDGDPTPYARIRNGERWYMAQVPVPVQIQTDKHFSSEVVLAAALFGVPSCISLRDAVRGYRRKLLPDFGLNESSFREVFPLTSLYR